MQLSLRIPALAGLVLSASLSSQTIPYADASPRVFTGAFAGGGNSLPFGRSGGLIQYWWRADNVRQPMIVTGLGVRPPKTSTTSGNTMNNVEIKISNTTASWGVFSNVFANNFGTLVTTFFTAKPVNLPPVTPTNDPSVPILWINADLIFINLGGNLVCQFDLGSAAGALGTPHLADGYLMSAVTSTLSLSSGTPCGSGTLLGQSPSSNNYVAQLIGAPANTPAAFMIGIEHTRLAGAVPLPLKLDIAGMPGCWLGLDPLVSINVLTDVTGGAALMLPIASPTESLVVYAQGVHVDTSKPTGFATTNVSHTILGGAGLTNYAYNWTRDGAVAEYGPYTTNRGPAILLK